MGDEMAYKDWIGLISALAWPLVALVGLAYIWRSDAVGKLIRISDAVNDLSAKLKELVEAEQKLRQTSGPILDAAERMNQVQLDFLSIKADVENIRDKVDHRVDAHPLPQQPAGNSVLSASDMFQRMDHAWQELLDVMEARFGWFDRRSVAAIAYRLTHANRNDALDWDVADEIAGLHSSIKSYRRRTATREDWLDQDIYEQFIQSCERVKKEVQREAWDATKPAGA